MVYIYMYHKNLDFNIRLFFNKSVCENCLFSIALNNFD